jgi:hypothetical protein
MEQQRLALIASNAHTNLPAGNSPGIPRSRGRRL